MNIYYTGVRLADIVTGFGGYTGISLINSGNYAVEYTAEISKTTLQGITPSDINPGSSTGTLFLSTDLDDVDTTISGVSIKINPSESGVIYLVHRPFYNFTTPFKTAGAIDGFETARITISSKSSIGDNDEDIIIDATGKRIKTFKVPPALGAFYGVKNYNVSSSQFERNFYWQVITQNTHFTSFEINTSNATNFSSATTNTFTIPVNTDSNLPLFGTYKGLYDIQFSGSVSLTRGSNYYARLRGVSSAGNGNYIFATGFNNYPDKLDGTTYRGLHPTPGANLLVDYEKMSLVRFDDYEIDFDLYEYLVQQNNNSLNFGRYSGINIKFISNTDQICKYVASSTDKGVINFNVPQNGPLILGKNGSNRFSIEMEFENCGLFGHGGDGVVWNGIESYVDAKNGGPIFNLDSYSYAGSPSIPVDYYIYKDIDSVFFAGTPGGLGWIVNTDNTENINTNSIKIDGLKLTDLSDFKFGQYTP